MMAPITMMTTLLLAFVARFAAGVSPETPEVDVVLQRMLTSEEYDDAYSFYYVYNSSQPTAAPTSGTHVVSTVMSLSGVDCDDIGDTEEAALVDGILQTLNDTLGALSGATGSMSSCTSTRRRLDAASRVAGVRSRGRRLDDTSSASVSIDLSIPVASAAAIGSTSVSDLSSSISSSLSANTDALATNIAAAATAAGTRLAVTVSDVSAFVATPTPTSSPTVTPEKVKDDLLPAWQIGLILLAAAIVVGLVGVAMSRVSCNDTSETYGKPETQI